MGLLLAEQETTVTVDFGERLVRVCTSVPKRIRAMRKDAAFTEASSETVDGEEVSVRFTVPESEWSPVTGCKRGRKLSDEQRKALTDRLKKVRENSQK